MLFFGTLSPSLQEQESKIQSGLKHHATVTARLKKHSKLHQIINIVLLALNVSRTCYGQIKEAKQNLQIINVFYRARKNGLQNVINTTQAGLGRLV